MVSPSTMVISPTPARHICSAAEAPTPPRPTTSMCLSFRDSSASAPISNWVRSNQFISFKRILTAQKYQKMLGYAIRKILNAHTKYVAQQVVICSKTVFNLTLIRAYLVLLYLQIIKPPGAMKITHIEHIGIAVKSLDEAIPFYENVFGLKCYNVEEVKEQKVKTAFFMVGQTKIELLESTDPEGPIGKFIEKKGEGVHHIAYAVDKIEDQLKGAEENGVKLIDQTPRKGAEGLDIAFLHPKSTFGVLTELCENKNK
jgi:methylmalonyl-CoA/ethylmalonyl-CoA epimerase